MFVIFDLQVQEIADSESLWIVWVEILSLESGLQEFFVFDKDSRLIGFVYLCIFCSVYVYVCFIDFMLICLLKEYSMKLILQLKYVD